MKGGLASRRRCQFSGHYHGHLAWERRIRCAPAPVTSIPRGSGPPPPGPAVTGVGPDPQSDRAWRVWERLRDFDRRYAIYVDVAMAVVLFVLCSGWLFDSHVAHPNLWVVAALISP